MGRLSLQSLRILIGAISILALTYSYGHAAEKLEILVVHYPPYMIDDATDDRRGYDVEVTDLALREAGYDPVFKAQEWSTILDRVKKGEATAIQSCTQNQKRAEWLGFSNAISHSTRGFFTFKKNIRLIEPVMLDSLSSFSVTAVKGYGTAYELETAGVALKEKPETDRDAFSLLAKSKVDLFYSTQEFGNWYARKELGFDESLRFYKRKGRPYYLCVSKAWPNYETVLKEFNLALSKIRQDGRYNAIHARYEN